MRHPAIGPKPQAWALLPMPMPNAACRRSVHARLEAVLLHLPVERRAADLEPLGDLRHVTAIAAERETDHVGFDVLERADVAVLGDGRDAERGRPGRRADLDR